MVVSLAGLAAELGEYLLGSGERLTELFSLSYEANVPTWYASSLLLVAALLLGQIAGRVAEVGGAHRRRWAALAGIFAYLSLDEAIEIHEYLVYLVSFETSGVLLFAWVIPATLLLAVLGAFYLPFLRDLPVASRRRFVVAGVIYVGGALLMELPLGWWVDHHGDDNLTYGVLDWVEETLELVGATLFIRALQLHLRSGAIGERPRESAA